jgi:hypothetical protein
LNNQKIIYLTLYNSKGIHVEYSLNSGNIQMKCDDEDGIKRMLQRAGGCCEPVQFLNFAQPF